MSDRTGRIRLANAWRFLLDKNYLQGRSCNSCEDGPRADARLSGKDLRLEAVVKDVAGNTAEEGPAAALYQDQSSHNDSYSDCGAVLHGDEGLPYSEISAAPGCEMAMYGRQRSDQFQACTTANPLTRTSGKQPTSNEAVAERLQHNGQDWPRKVLPQL